MFDAALKKRKRATEKMIMALSSPVRKLNLSDRQIKSVQTAWRRAKGSVESENENRPGLLTFQQIFMQMDDIRQVFGFEDFDDPQFIRHTRVFTDFLNKIIFSLNNQEEFDALCEKLGRTHARIRDMVFLPSFWDTFATSIISCALDEVDFQTQAAWRSVIFYMIYKMKEGYHDELLSK